MTTKITEINATTGEIIEREANSDELAQMATDKEMAKAAEANALAKAAEKAALLAKLGIDESDLKTLLS